MNDDVVQLIGRAQAACGDAAEVERRLGHLAELARSGEGMQQLAFRVADLDVASERLRSNGISHEWSPGTSATVTGRAAKSRATVQWQTY